MSTVYVGNGSIIIEFPDEGLERELSVFRHTKKGDGYYDHLYTRSPTHNAIVTMPGFRQRVLDFSGDAYVKDRRIPLPIPDIADALKSLHPVWHLGIENAIKSEGGVLSIPSLLGSSRVIAALLKAYPKDKLVERGTPISIVATRNVRAKLIGKELKRLLPDREIGIGKTDSDDIIVAPYSILDETPRRLAGIFIGDDVTGGDLVARAEKISAIHSAARWGIQTTPFGGDVKLDLAVEGLFGKVVASLSYLDAVKAGVGVPITVCWMKAPRPNVSLGSASIDMLEALAMQENPPFVKFVAEILQKTPSKIGCLLHTGPIAMSKRVSQYLPDVAEAHAHKTKSEQKAVLTGISEGTIRKAILSNEFVPQKQNHGVVIVATCRGCDFVETLFPWRALSHVGEKAYIVDFYHDWDVHNGRRGCLALNDEARKKRYEEFGFNQFVVSSIAQLPFIGS